MWRAVSMGESSGAVKSGADDQHGRTTLGRMPGSAEEDGAGQEGDRPGMGRQRRGIGRGVWRAVGLAGPSTVSSGGGPVGLPGHCPAPH